MGYITRNQGEQLARAAAFTGSFHEPDSKESKVGGKGQEHAASLAPKLEAIFSELELLHEEEMEHERHITRSASMPFQMDDVQEVDSGSDDSGASENEGDEKSVVAVAAAASLEGNDDSESVAQSPSAGSSDRRHSSRLNHFVTAPVKGDPSDSSAGSENTRRSDVKNDAEEKFDRKINRQD